MSFLKFEKTELINLKYSLSKEIVRTNRAGTFCSSTLPGCNTRKYHGLLISHLGELDGGKHVLLSSLDETIIQHGEEFNLGLHQYEGNIYIPRGHKYLRDFSIDIIPISTYRVGGVILRAAKLLVQNEERILIKYTLEQAHSETWLRLKPFLAFRNMHRLSKANMDANTRYRTTENGIIANLYKGYPDLYMQLTKKAEFVPAPDWYYDVVYKEEQRRGFEYKEDLFVPGYFEVKIKKGETIIFSAGLSPVKPASLKKKFTAELHKRVPRTSFKSSLINAAQQFIHQSKGNTRIVSGYPWLRSRNRDTFISLPGLLLANKQKIYLDAIDTSIRQMDETGLIPENRKEKKYAADTSLWMFWAIQKYNEKTEKNNLWKKYGKTLKTILTAYKKGNYPSVKLHDNGLIYAKEEGRSLTWMNASSYYGAVTPRHGYPVEVNALWYNAVSFAVQLAEKNNDRAFVAEWNLVAQKAKSAFCELFCDKQKKYLADFVDGDYKNWDVRPNQVIAVSMPNSPVSKSMIADVLKTAEKELLTPRGLRTLSPKNHQYKNKYAGNHFEREETYHQGTVWPFLSGFYVEASLQCFGKSFLSEAEKIYNNFEEEMLNYGIGTIGEVYNADPPFKPKGAISLAVNVAALLQIKEIIDSYK